tara:strand:- start:26 stop:430 length:405 start_codon:yes stop_codon:yes gene_type:complete
MSGPGIETRKRLAPFSLRLSDAERARLEAQAGGLPLASYIKSVVLAEDAARYRARPKPPVEDQRLLAAILARLGESRAANNLNQIAKGMHLGTLVVDDALEADLRQACVDVAWMRATLMQALGLRDASRCVKRH